MKKLIFAILLLSAQVYAAPGFFNPNDPKLPPKLKTAAESVYQVRTAFFEDYENYSDLEAIDLTKTDIKEVFAFIDNTTIDKQDKEIQKAFLKRCKTQEEKENCIIPGKISIGSGFITGSGSKLWTNAHVLERMLKTKAATNEKTIQDLLKSKNKMPLFIFDKNGNMVFNGLEEEVTFAAVPHQTQLTQRGGTFYGIDSDYLAIQLPKNIGKPLKVAKQLTSDDVASIGYPACTGCETPEGEDPMDYIDRAPYQNAENCLEKVTGGKLITPETFGQLLQINQQLMNSVDKRTFVAHTADSQHGMSGGPILNFNGEVVGINAGGKTIQSQNGIQRISRGVRPPELFKEP
ncbi:S1 family peptidase [Peredibacter starrii]|uniref:Serine protease n=1 Tax=Peredibacter starrii TaxID=28202 RepID=A0AAX4HU72_9BACT|nr:serine protease [Peredibacter starrii]WPU66740.1 serine protease [Peredibacter starrii]